ncbi:MAG: FliM/FliN family flagellar motor switch protein [Granulosicoccus sp.]|nr:FliM/FliN family flagellar motor switch protein [Granulosicoccus sp.]
MSTESDDAAEESPDEESAAASGESDTDNPGAENDSDPVDGEEAEDAQDADTEDAGAAETESAEASDDSAEPADDGPVLIDVTDPSASMVSHLPLFDLYCSNLTKHVADALESYIRFRPEIAAGIPAFKSYEPIGELPDQPSFDRIFQAAKPQGLIGVGVPRALVYRLVDILFGGKGDSDGDESERELSPTENKMIDVVAHSLTSGLQLLLRNSMATDSVPDFSLTNIQQIAKHVRSEPMVCIPLSVVMEDYAQSIEMWCSLSLLELVLGVSLLPRSDGKTVDPDWSALFKDQVLDCPLDLKCTLAEITMPLSRVTQMKKGDFIALSEIGEATFSMESLALFRARVGVVNDRASASFIEWL